MDAVIADEKLLVKIKELYEKYFPDEERKDFAMLVEKAREGKLEILGFTDEDKLVGFAVALPGEVTLVDYLAVDARFRSRGLGRVSIALLQERYRATSGILVEIEALGKAADTEQNILRARRKNFYIKSNFRDAKIPVLNMGVEMETMYLPVKTRSVPKNIKEQYLKLYNLCYGEEWTSKNIVILQN